MKSRHLLILTLAVALGSCSTQYRSGQTPDDVYYSPAIERPAYVSTETDDDRREYRGRDRYDEEFDDYALRMKVRNRYRWSAFDDPFYDWRWNSGFNSPYNSFWNRNLWNSWNWNAGLGWNSGFGWNTGFGWNNWLWNGGWACPGYTAPIVIINPKPIYRNPYANGPRQFNLNYGNTNRTEGVRPFTGKTGYRPSAGSAPVRVFNNDFSGRSSSGSSVSPRRSTGSRSFSNNDYRPSSSGSSRSFDRGSNSSPSRSSGSSSSGSRSSSGSSSPVRKF